ncbi:MAG: FtsX-like permease family protein [Candidatus Eisenbacteria bacterium]|nr:FtsX-like permease family protein [Candidatus Eisenbacteria bacterium]
MWRKIVKLGWRNLFRNKRRSILSAVSIGVGLTALIFVDAVIAGLQVNMVEAATGTYLGHAQIHREGYGETMELEQTIHRSDGLLADLSEAAVVEAFAPRVQGYAMLTSPANARAVSLVGIDPGREPAISKIDEAIRRGEYLGPQGERQLMIGDELAEDLEVELGDRLVVTVAQAGSGELYQEMFRLSGIYRIGAEEMDKGMAFVRVAKAQQMFGLDDRFHEIAVRFSDAQLGNDPRLAFWERFSRHGNQAEGWPDLVPQLQAMFDMSAFSTLIMGVILFGIVVFGIINTLFMAIYERTFEFGVLRAVGTRARAVAGLIVSEAAALAAISIVLGIILSLAVVAITRWTGIDYTGIEISGVTIREPLKPILSVSQFLIYPPSVFLLTTLVGLYPAVYAARLKPADALSRSF